MSFASENAKQANRPWFMVEIDGIRKRFANYLPSWNPADTGMNRHIDLLLAAVPKLGGQEVDPLNGTCTVANHNFALHDIDGEITAMLAVSNTPKAKTFLTASIPKGTIVHIAVDDFSAFDSAGHLYVERETFYYTAKTTRTGSGTADELAGQTADADPSGASKRQVFDAARTEDDDYWVDALLTFTGGANNGQARRVVRFIKNSYLFEAPFKDGNEQDTTLYLEPDNPLPNDVANGDTYTLHYSTYRMKDAALAGGGAPDYWLGARVLITADTDYPANVGELRWCKSWDETNKIIEFYEPLPGPTGTTTQFSITLYAFRNITRSLYGSVGVRHSVLDEKGEPIPVDVVDTPLYIKSRRVWFKENRVGCVESDAKTRVGSIDDYVLDPSGEVFSFTVSGIMKLLDNKIIARQYKAKLGIKPLWGGLFKYRISCVSGNPIRIWPTMEDEEITEFSVTEIFQEATIPFPLTGNIKVGSEIIHYIATGYTNEYRLGVGRFFKLAEEHIQFDALTDAEEYSLAYYYDELSPGMLGIPARGMFAEKIGIEQISQGLAYVTGTTLHSSQADAISPSISAFMEEHKIGDDIIQICVCDDSARSDFPRYDVIRVSSPAGTLTFPSTLVGGWGGGTATVVAWDAANYLLTVHGSSDDFRVPGESVTGPAPGNFTATIEEITKGDGIDLPARNNPISVLLQLLMSTGDGINGEFDTLQDGWGMGLDSDIIDVDAIKLLRDKYFTTTKIDFVLHEPVSYREWVENNIYPFLQIFPFETIEGKYSLAYLLVEEEARELDDGSLFEFDDDHIEARGLPDWTSGQPPVTKVIIKYNKHPTEGKYYGKMDINFKRSQTSYQEFGRTVKLESSVIYLAKALITSLEPNNPELPELISRIINPVWGRHSTHPAPIMRAMCPFADAAEVGIGDTTKVTHISMPNLRTGLRGLSGEYFQVLGTEPNALGGKVEFLLWQIGIHDNKYSLKAPSAKIVSYAADTPGAGNSTITLYSILFNRHTAPAGAFRYDRDDYVVGDEVMFLTDEYEPIAGATPEHATIKTIGSGGSYTVVLDQNLTNPPSLGDIMELATYDDNTSTRKSTRVFLGDEDRWLGAANDSAFKYR